MRGGFLTEPVSGDCVFSLDRLKWRKLQMMRAAEILKDARVETAPETYAVVGLSDADFRRLLETPEHSPRMSAPFLIFKDRFEVTLVVDETDLATMAPALRPARIERGFRLVTFDVELDFSVTGFIAEISRILAAADVPIFPISSFSRDHLLIRQADLGRALAALRDAVDELC
jgi:hypothetical protein